MAYLLLFFSIITEVFGSTMLKLSASYANKLAILGVIVGYGLCFYLFSLALLELPLGFAYAVWSGVGTVLTTMVGLFLFKEKINRQGVFGISLVLVGVVMINLAK